MMPFRSVARSTLVLLTLLLVLLAPNASHGADDEHGLTPAIRDAIVGFDYDKADALLRSIPIEHPSLTSMRGVLELHRQDCVRAKATFARPELQLREETPALREIANGCARVTALARIVRDDAAGVELRFQDENDVALAPQIVETVVAARASLARDLGVELARPARLTIVRDHLSLSAVTGLPYSAAKTTGVVGIAKWGRVTLLSPRATPNGYGWIDTLAHELTHLVITQATFDRAPLWLQEGLAKTEELRWRAPSPFDDRPPAIEMLKRGFDKRLDLPLEGLGASIALLPSAEQAAVAYAKVGNFVQMLLRRLGTKGMQALLVEVGNGHSVDGALKASTGEGLAVWETRWRTEVMQQAQALRKSDAANNDQKEARQAGQRLRLGELLIGRDKLDAALIEITQVKAPFSKDDPRVRTLRGRVRELRGEAVDLGDPFEPMSSYGSLWAMHARAAKEKAEQAYIEASRVDPLNPEVACKAREAYIGDVHTETCEAAKTRREPLTGRE
jgi:hypothetical protein